jgi:hypothetical protein
MKRKIEEILDQHGIHYIQWVSTKILVLEDTYLKSETVRALEVHAGCFKIILHRDRKRDATYLAIQIS